MLRRRKHPWAEGTAHWQEAHTRPDKQVIPSRDSHRTTRRENFLTFVLIFVFIWILFDPYQSPLGSARWGFWLVGCFVCLFCFSVFILQEETEAQYYGIHSNHRMNKWHEDSQHSALPSTSENVKQTSIQWCRGNPNALQKFWRQSCPQSLSWLITDMLGCRNASVIANRLIN